MDWSTIAGAVEIDLTDMASGSGKKALALLGVADDQSITSQVHTKAAEWAKARSAELVGRQWDDDDNLVANDNAEMTITETMRDDIRDAVADAIESGDSAADLSDTIEGLGSFSEERATMIARTELIRANNAGSLAAMRESGVVEKKEWTTAEDDDVSEDCEGNSDQGAIDLDDTFESGDDAPPAHPNCRCALVAHIQDSTQDSDEGDEEESEEEAAE